MGVAIIIFTKLMLLIFLIIKIFIVYIEISMGICIICIGILAPLYRFDCINFKASLIIKIIKFNEFLKMVHLVMLVIFHVNVITLSIFQFTTHLSHLCWENSFFDMKIFKLITWYPNMVQNMWNDMVQYNLTFIKIKNHLNFFWNIFVFFST